MMCPIVSLAQKPIILVVPFVAGGPTDHVAKIIQKTLSQELDRAIVIEYRPGAGGDIANSAVANWNKDDTVLLLQSSSLAASLAINGQRPSLVPMVYLGTMPLILAVSPRANLSDLSIWQATDARKTITWGSAGVGSSSHMYGEIFRHKIQKNLIHVPYKGMAQIIPDLVAGNIDAAFLFHSVAEPFIKTGRIVPVAVGASRRLRLMPGVPTFQELQLDGMDFYSWWAVLTNQNLPEPERRRITQAMMHLLAKDDIQALFQQAGLEGSARTIDSVFLAREIQRYKEVIKAINYKVDQ